MKRNHFLDLLRGLSLISMLVYHFFYDLVHIFNFSFPWYAQWPGFVWQQSILMSFVLISGYSSNLAQRPVKNGITLLLWGFVIFLVTYFFLPEELILFGVLSFLGVASILAYYLKPFLDKVPCSLGTIVSFLLFLLTRNVFSGTFGAYTSVLGKVPQSWYNIDFLFPLGFPHETLWSADYVPVIPWIFLFLCGRFLGKKIILPDGINEGNVLVKLGRHSLGIYLLHQPVIYIFLLILSS